MRFMKFMLFVIILSAPNAALAGLVTMEFNNGDSLAGWSVDRSAPAGFAIVNNELKMTIDGSTQFPLSDDFNNTRGMQMAIANSTYLSVDMYIDSGWANVPNERFAGLWAIGFSNTIGGDSKTFPIMEYQRSVTEDGIAIWDSVNGWQASLSQLFNFDEFNNLKFIISGAGVEYYINDILAYIDTDTNTEFFTGVILNARNEGNDFMVRYDNLTYGNIPEPAPMALLGLGLLGFGLMRRRRG